MTTSLWSETRKQTITTRLKLALAGAEKEAAGMEDGPQKAGTMLFAERLRESIARREADPRFVVTLRHIGAPEKDGGEPDPFRYARLKAEEESAIHAARTRARRALGAAGEAMDEAAITEATGRDATWHAARGGVIKGWLAAGLVDGANEYHRLYALGCEEGGAAGGMALLVHAADEVKAYQEMPAPKA